MWWNCSRMELLTGLNSVKAFGVLWNTQLGISLKRITSRKFWNTFANNKIFMKSATFLTSSAEILFYENIPNRFQFVKKLNKTFAKIEEIIPNNSSL